MEFSPSRQIFEKFHSVCVDLGGIEDRLEIPGESIFATVPNSSRRRELLVYIALMGGSGGTASPGAWDVVRLHHRSSDCWYLVSAARPIGPSPGHRRPLHRTHINSAHLFAGRSGPARNPVMLMTLQNCQCVTKPRNSR
jgi:hypothetical protein